MKKEKIIENVFFISSWLVLLVLIWIFLFLFFIGLRAFFEIPLLDFLFGREWNPAAYGEPSFGIFGLFVSTLMVTGGALVIGVPLGIGGAIYLSQVARPSIRESVKPIIEMIASIPSVVLGLIGIVFLVPLIAKIFGLNSGLTGLTSSIIVGIMILPTITSISEDVLTSLPKEFKEASLALGATRWQTIRMVLLPAAFSGIVASIMLGLGRAVGETMAVLMVAGNSRAFPTSFLEPVRPMTANIAIEIKEVVRGSLHYEALFAIGLVLFLITFAVNAASDIIIERNIRRHRW